MIKGLLIALPITLTATAPAAAQVVRDQSTLVAPNTFQSGAQVWGGGAYYNEVAQTFTVGTSGILNRVEVMVNGDVATAATFRLRSVTGGVIAADNALALGSFAFIAPAWSPSFGRYSITSIDVSALNLSVAAGQMFAISVEAEQPVLFGWAGSGNVYSGGRAFDRTTSTGAWDSDVFGLGSNSDTFFATYVDVGAGAVPEPASWAMMIVGFGIVGGGMRSRRRREVGPLVARSSQHC